MTFIGHKLASFFVGLFTILYGASSDAFVLAIEPLPRAKEAKGQEKLFCVDQGADLGVVVILPSGSFAKVSKILGLSLENCLHSDFPVLAEVNFLSAAAAFRQESRAGLTRSTRRPVGLSIAIPEGWEAQEFIGAMKTDGSTIAYLLNKQIDLSMSISISIWSTGVGSLDSFVESRRGDFQKISSVSEARSSEIRRFQLDGIEIRQFYTVVSFKPSSKRFKFIRHFLATDSHLIHVQFHGAEDKVDSGRDHIDSVLKSVTRVKSNFPSAAKPAAAQGKSLPQVDLSPQPPAKPQSPHEICEQRGFKKHTDRFLECVAIFGH